MWSPTSRRQHSRRALRYGSDLTDAEWAILEPLLPPPCACGRKRKWPMRRIVEAIFFIMRAGCAWDMLPDGFPPFLTVYRWFARFRDDGTWERINHHLVMQDRERVGRGRRSARLRCRQEGEGAQAPCVTNIPTEKEVWCCTRDEGGPLEVGSQVQASNRCKLRPSRATVVSVAETSERDSGRYDPKRRARANRR